MGVIFIITLYANIIIFVKVFIMEKKDVKLEFIDKSEKAALITIEHTSIEGIDDKYFRL